ncbi:hypothetical protein BH24ACT23_BH24ACT23_08410 [soil metagenome]
MAAEPSSVRLARSEIMRWFHEQGRFDDGLATSIALAVSEAVANVVRHAYPGSGNGRVEIEAELRDAQIRVDVSDGGTGLQARPQRDHNGMGLPVIGRVADGVTVVSDDAGTTVSMRFDTMKPVGRRSFLRRAASGSYAVSAR